MTETKSAIEELERARQAQAEKLVELRGKLAELDRSISETKASLAAEMASPTGLEEVVAELRGTLAQLEKERPFLVGAVAKGEESLRALDSQLAEARAEAERERKERLFRKYANEAAELEDAFDIAARKVAGVWATLNAINGSTRAPWNNAQAFPVDLLQAFGWKCAQHLRAHGLTGAVSLLGLSWGYRVISPPSGDPLSLKWLPPELRAQIRKEARRKARAEEVKNEGKGHRKAAAKAAQAG